MTNGPPSSGQARPTSCPSICPPRLRMAYRSRLQDAEPYNRPLVWTRQVVADWSHPGNRSDWGADLVVSARRVSSVVRERQEEEEPVSFDRRIRGPARRFSATLGYSG